MNAFRGERGGKFREDWNMRQIIWAAALLMATAVAAPVEAQLMAQQPQAEGAGGSVTLPYLIGESGGNQWRVYQSGWLQQQGNAPLYSQGAMLLINGNQVNQGNNEGTLDQKTGELVIDGLNGNGFLLTRRILFNQTDGYVRYIDVIKNVQGQDQTASVTIQSNMNYGVNSAQMVADPKKADHNLAWVAQTGAGQSVVEVFGGRGAKNVPTITWPQGNNYVQATMSLSIPAGKQVALMHFHAIAPTQDAGTQFVNALKLPAIMRSIPHDLRRLIVNFVGGENFVGDIEILRGDLLDVVELRTGDQFKGTLEETSYDLQTFYGEVSVPVERVIGLINVGRFRPQQLIITVDGEVLGGQLKKQTIDLQLSSGQVTQIPLAQIARIGYHRQTDEPAEWNFEGRSLVMTRSGERVGIQLPADPVDVLTRYGRLSLKPEQIAGIILQSEEKGDHEIQLIDGSRFAGLLVEDRLTAKLQAGKNQTVQFPIGQISRIQFAGKVAEETDLTPTLRLANDDVLVGSLTGGLKLDTAFDTITVNAAEVKSLQPLTEGGPDVQVVLWDGASVSGQLEGDTLSCQLQCGVSMSVPLQLCEQYSQPRPYPSAQMLDKIKEAIKDLDNSDWKRRDRAVAVLTSMGPVAAGVLSDLRENQSEEAQRSIDNVLKELERQRLQQKAAGASGPQPIVPAPNIQGQ